LYALRTAGRSRCAALLNLGAAPAIYLGTNAAGFYTADGLPSFVGLLPLLLWLLSVSVAMIVRREVATTKLADLG
jgi:hypothetical protein